VRHRRHFSANDSAIMLAAIGECRRACIAASSKAPVGGPIYRAATRLIEEIDLRRRGAHRRSTTLLAQTVEHSGLKATDGSTTRHLRLDLGADEGRAGPRAAQSIRSGRAMIVDHSVLLELNPRDRSDFTEFCMPIVGPHQAALMSIVSGPGHALEESGWRMAWG
jgi:hypothetical protein